MCADVKMEEEFDMKLLDVVRSHPNLYNSSLSTYSDIHLCSTSWNEIAETLGKDERHCRYRWRYLRDRFVKAKRKLEETGVEAADYNVHPGHIYSRLSWLSDFIKHRKKDVRSPSFLDSSKQTPSQSESDQPLSSLHLLVPPLRLLSASMWQVAQDRNVDEYGKLVDFITLVTEMVPELLDYKQRTQLILGLRARIILELLQKNKVTCNTFQIHLKGFQQTTTNVNEEDGNGEVEISKSNFLELVQKLLRDKSEKEMFFKEVFPVQYGARFDTALQILVWEFLYQLEEFVPVPSFSQVFSTFGFSALKYKFDQSPAEQEKMKRILTFQRQQPKLPKSEFNFIPDTIFSTLSSKKSLVSSDGQLDLKDDEENVCSLEDLCDDDEAAGFSSAEQEFGLSPLSSSQYSEDSVGKAAFQPEKMTEELVQSSEKKGESAIQSSSKDKVEAMLPFSNTLTNNHSVPISPWPFRCTFCLGTYKNSRNLINHSLRHHNAPLFVCSYCKKSVTTASLFTTHLRSHMRERPYACTYCDKRFYTKSILKSHIFSHTGERPYPCPLCDKKFTQPYMRTVHLRVHLNDRPYLCSDCGKACCSSGELLVHSRTHTGERPYQCEFCDKRYTCTSSLSLHRSTHTRKKPFSCSYCNKKFSGHSGLKKHVRTHTGEKPYKCVTCHKTFTEKGNMKTHLKVHGNI